MKSSLRLVVLLALAVAAPTWPAEEPPIDDIIEQLDLSDTFERPTDGQIALAEELLRAKWLIYDERLSRSGAHVVKFNERIPGIENIPPTERYIEVEAWDIGGEPTVFVRNLPPEEVQKRKAAESGLSPELMAKALQTYAAGAIATGEIMRRAMQSSELGSLMTSSLGFPLISGSRAATGIDSEDVCWGALMTAVHEESTSVAEEGGIALEVKPWTSINPVSFMMGPACMALHAAEVFEKIDGLDPETRQQMAQALEDALDQITFVGLEEINGRPTFRLRIDDLDMTQSLANLQPVCCNGFADRGADTTATAIFNSAAAHPNYRPAAAGIESKSSHQPVPAVFFYEQDVSLEYGAPYRSMVQQVQVRGGSGAGTIAIHSIDFWIDAEYFVDRKMRMEGVMTENGQSREVFMEQEFHDYRNVPDSALYEPYRKVMRAGGMLTDAQRAELAQAQQQLAEFEQQMASMPASQRQMMENMLGGQIEQMRNLVNNGTVEIEMITTSIEVNPSFHDPMLADFARQNMSSPADGDAEKDLLRRIQLDLATLGYEPGNTDGVLDTMTQIAISQFEAEAGLPVTGEPSQALAMALAQAVASR